MRDAGAEMTRETMLAIANELERQVAYKTISRAEMRLTAAHYRRLADEGLKMGHERATHPSRPPVKQQECRACEGTGRRYIYKAWALAGYEVECQECDGTGWIGTKIVR